MKPTPKEYDEELKKAERIAYLIAGHITNSLSEQEKDELDTWIVDSDENLELFERLTDEDNIAYAMQQHKAAEEEQEEMLNRVKQAIGVKKKKSQIRTIAVYLVAASLIVAIVSVFIFWPKGEESTSFQQHANNENEEVQPGSEKAVLTLSDGRTIILDKESKGVIAEEGGIAIQKDRNGIISYKGEEVMTRYNVVSTPRGGFFQIALQDGTVVWLNAESRIRYPAAFGGDNREVEVSGEVYFEVMKDERRPFIVRIKSRDGGESLVEVLGTRFNVNSYGDTEPVLVTLAEGSVRVESRGQHKQMVPGEQAVIGDEIKLRRADAEEVTAWREGKFLFRDATINDIGEQIRRWYDVEVIYEGEVKEHFNIEVSRQAPLERLLNGLEGTGEVRFELQGRKLVIKP